MRLGNKAMLLYNQYTVEVSFLARDRESDREFFLVKFSSRSFWYMSGIYMGTVRYAHDHAPITKQ
jgi:hypothetical protein